MPVAVARWFADAASVLRAARRCLPVEARRPASWIGAAAAAATAWWLAAGAGSPGRSLVPGVILGGALATLAAVGDPPRGVRTGRLPPPLFPLAAVLAARAAWPAVVALTAPVCGASVGSSLLAAAVVALAARTVGDLARSGADAAETAGGTALAAVIAAAAATVPGPWGVAPPGGQVLLAAVGWALAWAALRAWQAGEGGLRERDGGDRGTVVGWPVASGHLGRGLVAGAMLGALAAMAGWLFLDPAGGGRYAAWTAAVFVTVALPRATLGWGACGSAARSRLLATVAGPGGPGGPAGVARWLDRVGGVGFIGPEWRAPVTLAAILGWPAAVALAVAGAEGAGGQFGLLRSVLEPVVWAVALTVTTVATLRMRGSRETAYALAVALALVWAVIGGAASALEHAGNAGRNGVEESGASCETPQPQSSPAGVRPRRVCRTPGRATPAHRLTRGVNPCEEA